MRKAVCILCRNYNETWITFLKSFKNYDVYMVIDDNTIIYPKKINNVFIIQIPDEECMKSHYYNSSVASNLKPIVSWDRALYYFSTMGIRQTLSSHSSTPEFQRNVTPNGSTFLQSGVEDDNEALNSDEKRVCRQSGVEDDIETINSDEKRVCRQSGVEDDIETLNSDEKKVCRQSGVEDDNETLNSDEILTSHSSSPELTRITTSFQDFIILQKRVYENIWFLEDDVFIMNEDVLLKIDEKYPTSHLLSAFHEINEKGDVYHGWNHWVNVIHRIGTPWAHSLISASRLSNVLLYHINDYVKDRPLLFIESLFNTLALHKQLQVDNPDEMKETITYDKKWDREQIDISKIYHPFKKMEDHEYIRKKNKYKEKTD